MVAGPRVFFVMLTHTGEMAYEMPEVFILEFISDQTTEVRLHSICAE
jgi:hypothetical protein